MTRSADFYRSVPDLSQASFVANNATVIGDVYLDKEASVWYGAVVRGDVERIVIGEYTNIQDGAVLHGDPNQPTILESYVTVGHRAVIHSAYIETGCLIGIGAIILNGVRIGAGSIVGAGSVVTKDIPKRSLVIGVPARKVKDVDDTKALELLEHARNYAKLGRFHSGTGNDLGFK